MYRLTHTFVSQVKILPNKHAVHKLLISNDYLQQWMLLVRIKVLSISRKVTYLIVSVR